MISSTVESHLTSLTVVVSPADNGARPKVKNSGLGVVM